VSDHRRPELVRLLGRLSAFPHLALAGGAGVVLGLEALRGSSTRGFSPAFPLAQALVAGVALLLAWRGAHRLELRRVLLLTVLFQVGLIAVHLGLGLQPDGDVARVYPRQGLALLHGGYPRSEYPSGAVLLFALETWLGGGSARIPHAFLMVVPQAVIVAAIWRLRTRWSRWFAALAGLWPLNAFFWEFRYDLMPAAALVAGLLLARTGRLGASGACFGLGAALKWVPALSLVAMTLWLLCRRRPREAAVHAAAGAAVFAIIDLPFLLWRPRAFAAAYSLQGGRGITGESLPYLLLHVVGLAHIDGLPYYDAARPAWADRVAVAGQAIVIVLMLVAVARARSQSAAVALAALLPAAFLLTNRIFSAQFLVFALAVWAVAASLVVRTAREQLLVGAGIAVATTANTLIYPAQASHWVVASALLFAVACGLTVALVARARAPLSTLAAPPEPAVAWR